MCALHQQITLAAKHRSRGVSLIEIILTIMLVGVIGALGTQMLEGGFSAYFLSKDVAEMDWQGQIALNRMSRDILRLRSATGADLVITPTDQLTMTDYDGAPVSYTRSGTTLMRNGTPLADGINTLNFSYLKSDGITAATLPAEVYYISVDFTVVRGAVSRPWRTTLQPRNLR